MSAFSQAAISQKNPFPTPRVESTQPSDAGLKTLLVELLELSPSPTAVVCPAHHHILLQNNLVPALFGVSDSTELTCLSPDFYGSPTDYAEFINHLQQKSPLIDYRVQMKRCTGELFNALISAKFIEYEGSSALLLVWSSVNYQSPAQESNCLVAVQPETTRHSQAEMEWQKFAALVENSTDFIAMASLEGKILYVNEAGRSLVGLDSLETAQSLNIAAYLPTEDLSTFCEVTLPTLLSTGRHEGEGRLRHLKTGECFDMHRSCFVVKHPQTAEVLCLATIQRNVTDEKKAERALQKSEERFRAIAEALPIPMTISNIASGEILYTNQQGELTFGQFDETLMGRNISELYANPRDFQALLTQIGRDEYVLRQEVRVKKLNGTLFWVNVSLQRLTLDDQPVILSTFYDVTARKQTEKLLKTLALQQSAVAELGQHALSGMDIATLMDKAVRLVATTLNVELCAILERLPGGNALQLTAGVGWKQGLMGTARVSSQRNSQIGYTLQTQTPVIVEDFRIDRRFGGPPLLHNHRVVSSINVVIPGQEQPFGVLGGYTTDLHSFTQDDVYFLQAIANVLATTLEQKQAEAQLRLMERAITASSNGIVITDANQPDNPIIYVNPAFAAMSGYSSLEVLGKNCRFLQGEESEQPALLALRTALEEQRECHVTLRNYRKDGTLFWNDLCVAPVFDAQGYLTHYVGVQTDITQRIEAEEALRQQEEQYRRIVETAVEGIWVLDRENQTSFANQQMATMLGYSVDEMMGETLFSFMDEEGIAMAKANLERRREGISEAHDFKFRCKDGTDLWVIVSTSPFFDEQGHYDGTLGMITDITARKRAEAALQESEHRLSSILRDLDDVVWSTSIDGSEIYYLNPATEKVYGRPLTDFFDSPNFWLEVVHPEDKARVQAESQSVLETGSNDIEYRILQPSGQVRWLRDRCQVIFDSSGKAMRLDGIATDITDRKQALEDLQKSEALFRVIFELAPIGMALNTLDGHFLKVNQAFCRAVGYTPTELVNRTFADITHPEDLEIDLVHNRKLLRGELPYFQLEKRYLAKDGSVVNALLQSTLIRDADGHPLHTIDQVVDISERKRVEEQLVHDAFHDALTGLPNRLLFMDRLRQTLERLKRDSYEQFAVLFIDLDRFKVINDSLGHLVGDQLLVAIAQRLQACLRPGDTVARLGGDEFTILLNLIEDAEDVTNIAERILQSLCAPLYLDGQEVFVTSSIGIVLNQSSTDSPEVLLRNADTALYQAKERGKNRYVVFNTKMYEQAVALLQLETDLRGAIIRHELRVFYQPIISLSTGRITGFEALVRWLHPQRGLISPAEFIPVAEDTGLIVQIDQWVLWTACNQLRHWQTKCLTHQSLSMNVNLSSKLLSQPKLIQKISQVLQQTGLAPDRLKLEITESEIMEHSDSAATILQELKALGVQLCIDDFGTGYSSLSRLHEFPIDTLKIDRSFVNAMGQSGTNTKMVQAIVSLSHNLNMAVVAEGVETTAQLAQLRLLGCEYGQGYFFSKPLNHKAAEKLIDSNLIW